MKNLSSRQIEIIDSIRVARLATVSSNASPHVVPICFVYNGFSFYSALDKKPKRTSGINLKRTRNILRNPKVTLLLDHYEEHWDQLWYVLITGHGEILESGHEHQEAIRLLRQKYPQYQAMAIDEVPLIKISPSNLVIWGTPF